MDEAISLLDWLAKKFPASSRTSLRKMLADRRVSVNGQLALRADTQIAPADRVVVADRPRPAKPHAATADGGL